MNWAQNGNFPTKGTGRCGAPFHPVMLTLYSVPHSLYCSKTRLLLRAKGLTWDECDPPGGSTSAAYRALFPFGNLPGIVHDGFALSDSEAIAEYLEEAFPAPAMLPQGAQARARVRERSRFHDTRLEPALRGLFPHVARPDPAAVRSAMAMIAMRLEQLAVLVDQPHAFDLGDCGYPATFLWITLLAEALEQDLLWPPAVVAYRARLEAMPWVAAELTAYQPHCADWVRLKRGAS
jgi:glutathione S-transferase